MAKKNLKLNTKTVVLSLLAMCVVAFVAYLLMQVRPQMDLSSQNPPQITNPRTIIIPEATPSYSVDTENDGVYTSYQYGYKFSYPLSYNISGSDSYLQILSPDDPSRTRERTYDNNKELEIEIVAKGSPDNDNIDKFLAEVVESQKQAGTFKLLSTEVLTISGLKSYHLKFEDGDFYLILNRNSRITISKFPLNTDLQKTFDKVLHSFEFFKPSSTP